MKFKIFSSLLLSMIVLGSACAQQDKSNRKSPPASAKQVVGDAKIVIEYSQPSAKGREIFGGLVKFDQVWRTGANECTTFETSAAVTVQGKELPAGKYSLFTIPGEEEWTIIFNSDPKQWGAYSYSKDKDVLRVKAKPAKHDMTEKFTISISKEGVVSLDWAETRVDFKVK